MTTRRDPDKTPDLEQPPIYPDEKLALIIDAAGLPIVGDQRAWLGRELHACVIAYSAGLAADKKSATGQKTTAAWHEFIADLASAFGRAFDKKAAGTPGGPFCRFARVALEQIGLSGITDQMIRDTLRGKQPSRSK
jgi:hypothetical protein